MKRSRLFKILVVFISCIGLSQTAYSAFKTGRIGGARNLVATPVVDLITALNAKLGQVQLSQLLSNPGQWLANSDIEDLNLNLESFGGFPLDQHELAFLTHSLATALSDNSTTLGSSQASLQSLINSSVTNGACRSSNCSETSADWVHGQVSDESFANADNVNLISATLLDDLMSGDSSHVEGYTSIVLGANSAVGIQDLRDDGFFRSISNPSGNQPPPATDIRNAINHIAGFVQPATVGAPTPAEYTAGQTLADNFLNNNDRSNFTLANFISCFNNNEAARSGGQGTCSVSASAWDQQVTALANFNAARSRLAGGTDLTVADLQAIPVTFGGLTAPIQEWHADYISSQLGTGDTVSLSDWQNTINNINEGVAARWKIQQVADNATGHEPNDVTNHLLARATDGTFDVSTALGAEVSKTAPGFGASTNISGLTSTSTPAQIQSAILSYIGFTDPIYAAWLGNNDRANFALADFTSCYNDTSTSRSGGSSQCTVTSSDWAFNNSYLAYFNSAKTRLSNGETLTQSDFENAGLSFGNFFANPLENWHLNYISATLDRNASAPSDWQTAVDAMTASTASIWTIGNIADNVTAVSALTNSVIDAALGSDNATSVNGFDIVDLRNLITSQSAASLNNTTNIENWIAQTVYGFPSYSSFVSGAGLNGWSVDDGELYAQLVGGTTEHPSAWADLYCQNYGIDNGVTYNACTDLTAAQFRDHVSEFNYHSTISFLPYDDIISEDNLTANATYRVTALGDLSNKPFWEWVGITRIAKGDIQPVGWQYHQWNQRFDNYTRQQAAILAIDSAADNDYDGWTTDNLTEEIFDIALGLDVTNLLNMTSPASTINDIITWPSFASRFDDWRTYDPFRENVTTYTEHFLTALGAGYASNMLNNPDYQNFTIASWNACQQSNDRIKAPSRPDGWNVRGFCEITASEWESLSGLASTSSDNITTSTLQDIISLTSATNANNAFVNLASLTNFEADYIRNCVGTSVSSSSIRTCVTNATSALVNTQKVSGMIAGAYSGTPTISDFQNAGIGSVDTATGSQNVLNFLNSSVCGDNGTSPCSEALNSTYTDASLVASAGSSSDTQGDLLDYLQDALVSYSVSQADAVVAQSVNDTSCGTIRIPAPKVCSSNQAFTCTALDGFEFTPDRLYIEKNIQAVQGSVTGRVTFTSKPWWNWDRYHGSTYSRTVSNTVTVTHGGSFNVTRYSDRDSAVYADLNACFSGGGVVVAADNIEVSYPGAIGGPPNYHECVGAPFGGTDLDRTAWNNLPTGENVGGIYQDVYNIGTIRECNTIHRWQVEAAHSWHGVQQNNISKNPDVTRFDFYCKTPRC